MEGVHVMHSTESVNPRFVSLDSWPTQDAVEAMLEGQLSAVAALKNQVPALAQASEAAADRLRLGGRLVYVGAGTSGRIAVQDGVELGPTFGWPQDRLVFLLAGGMAALAVSAEGAEDDRQAAAEQIETNGVGARDVVIGVAASGRTAYTLSAVESGRRAGALTIGVSNNPGTPLLEAAEHPILADTGSELVAGSTRMKAGTAQKAALNMISTAIMLRLGRVHQGLMVDMVISNNKLRDRAHGMVSSLTGCTREEAADAVKASGNDIKKAVLVAKGMNPDAAGHLLEQNQNILGRALGQLERKPT
jgi:N-acetylmuramic acid 6-phosphate etherase